MCTRRRVQALGGNLFLTSKWLKNLIVWKQKKGDNKLPLKNKEDLLALLNTAKDRASSTAVQTVPLTETATTL